MTLSTRACVVPDPAAILRSVGEAMYEWRIADDRLDWSDGAEQVLQIPDCKQISTGRGFAQFLDPGNLTSRHDTVVNSSCRDLGQGVPYQIQYRFSPGSARDGSALWIEDTGRWFAGLDGRPVRAHGIVRAINERYESERRLAYLSRHDPATGLVNRAELADVLSRTLSDTERLRTSFGFLIAGIDNVDVINEAYGFDVVDEVIVAVAGRLKARLRSGDTLGRFSGSKFGVVLMNCNQPDLVIAADRLVKSVRGEVIQTARGPVATSISLGGVVGPRYASSPQEVMHRAQDALDDARRNGGAGSFSAFHHSRERMAARQSNMKLTEEVVTALNQGRLALAYQPVVVAGSAQVAFYECLLRLAQSDGALLSAGRLIPTIERLGLSRLIDHRVLELVIDDLIEDPDIVLSLNISAETAASAEWLALLTSSVRKSRTVASRLIVEITETMVIHNVDETTRFVRALHELGCRVAIDDFGAGYSSFRSLRLLGVDLVKIDGSYVENLSQSEDDQIFVRALLDLTRNCGLQTVAEWVRHESDAALLREWGVDYLQGHLYGPGLADKPWRRSLGSAAAG